jgi:hypothetical protein
MPIVATLVDDGFIEDFNFVVCVLVFPQRHRQPALHYCFQ